MIKRAAFLGLLTAGLLATSLLVAAAAPSPAIWVTPKFWTESKEVRYYPDGHEEYVTHGWWFEKSAHTFPGEPGAVDVTKAVYDMLLRPWVNGKVAPLCNFGFVDREPAASKYNCEQGDQSFLAVVLGRQGNENR